MARCAEPGAGIRSALAASGRPSPHSFVFFGEGEERALRLLALPRVLTRAGPLRVANCLRYLKRQATAIVCKADAGQIAIRSTSSRLGTGGGRDDPLTPPHCRVRYFRLRYAAILLISAAAQMDRNAQTSPSVSK